MYWAPLAATTIVEHLVRQGKRGRPRLRWTCSATPRCLYRNPVLYICSGFSIATRGRAARAGVDHTAGGMAEAPAHTEELLDRRAVEAGGCHGTQGAEDFVKG